MTYALLFVPLIAFALLLAGRVARRRRTSIERFAEATAAMRSMADHPRALADVDVRPVVSTDEPSRSNLSICGESRGLFDPAVRRVMDAARHDYRPDAEAIARRPMVASLPTMPSTRVKVGADATVSAATQTEALPVPPPVATPEPTLLPITLPSPTPAPSVS